MWSLDNLHLENYGAENKRGCSYVLIIIDTFSNFGWTVLLKNKNILTKKDSFEDIIISSNRKLN